MSQGQDIIICNYLFLSRIPTCHKTLASKVMYKDHVISYEQSAHDESLVTPRSQRDYFSNLVLLNSNNKTLSKNNKSPSTSVCLSRPSHPQQLLISPIFCAQQLQRACSMVHMKHRQPPPPPPSTPSSTCHDVHEQWPTCTTETKNEATPWRKPEDKELRDKICDLENDIALHSAAHSGAKDNRTPAHSKQPEAQECGNNKAICLRQDIHNLKCDIVPSPNVSTRRASALMLRFDKRLPDLGGVCPVVT